MIYLLLLIIAQFFLISVLARALWFVYFYSIYKDYFSIFALDINNNVNKDNIAQYTSTWPMSYIVLCFWRPKYWILRTFMSYPEKFDEVIIYVSAYINKLNEQNRN